MAFVVKTAKTLRNNWKKSTFAALALMYGYGYTKEHFAIQELMRVYCEKAARYGEQPLKVDVEPRSITVILNPNANKRKATDEFEKYCAPILHLAGICVNIIKTESEGHAKNLINNLDSTNAIVVAGGDGTFSEVITGLLRRTQENTKGLIPLGVLPLGRTNSLSKILYGEKIEKVKALADATMAVVEEAVKPIDVLKVEVIESENKPIYAVAGIKWGAYRDAEARRDNYWLYGQFRKYVTYLFNGYRSGLTWNCQANISFTPPCAGCSNCCKTQTNNRWFHRFSKENQLSSSKIISPECKNVYEKYISTVDFNLSIDRNKELPKLVINIGPNMVDYLEFVKQGWRSENGQNRKIDETVEARTVEIHPKVLKNSQNEQWFSIDNENFELKPIKVTLLPKLINVFCKKESL